MSVLITSFLLSFGFMCLAFAAGWLQGRRTARRHRELTPKQKYTAPQEDSFGWRGTGDPGPRMRQDIEQQLHRTAMVMFMSGKSREEILATIQPLASMNYPGCRVRIATIGGRLRFSYSIPKEGEVRAP
jgi:hypothetical protein